MDAIQDLKMKLLRVMLEIEDDLQRRIFDFIYDGALVHRNGQRLSIPMVIRQPSGPAVMLLLSAQDVASSASREALINHIQSLSQTGQLYRLCELETFWRVYDDTLVKASATLGEREAIARVLTSRFAAASAAMRRHRSALQARVSR